MSRLRILLRKTLLGFSLILLAVFSLSVYQIQAFSTIDETQRADVAIVLGAAAWRNRPSPVFAERINHAIELYRQGWVRAIIFTGGYGRNPNMADSEIAREYAIQRGVPPYAIHIETVSTNTEENLVEAAKLMQARGWHSALLVSDPLHMYRTQLLADEQGLEASSSPTRTSRYRSAFSRGIFLLRETYSLFQHWLLSLQS